MSVSKKLPYLILILLATACGRVKMYRYAHGTSAKLTVLPYFVVNKTAQTIGLNVHNYPSNFLDVNGSGKDTLVVLKPNDSFMVGTARSSKAGFFSSEYRKLFKADPGRQNFSLIVHDSIVNVNNNENWKYKNKCALFEIEDAIPDVSNH